MSGNDWPATDDRLQDALGEALRAADPTPPAVLEAARAAFIWRTIDAELAELVHDSRLDDLAVAGLRADQADLRTLTFESADLTIELGVAPGVLLGQLIPYASGVLALRLAGGEPATVPTDELGCFRIAPPPPALFTLTWQTPDGRQVTTAPIRL